MCHLCVPTETPKILWMRRQEFEEHDEHFQKDQAVIRVQLDG